MTEKARSLLARGNNMTRAWLCLAGGCAVLVVDVHAGGWSIGRYTTNSSWRHNWRHWC